jgi:hypothetical protein
MERVNHDEYQDVLLPPCRHSYIVEMSPFHSSFLGRSKIARVKYGGIFLCITVYTTVLDFGRLEHVGDRIWYVIRLC